MFGHNFHRPPGMNTHFMRMCESENKCIVHSRHGYNARDVGMPHARHHYQTCTDATIFPCGERSTCCSSIGYTWSQVVSFHWIMAMIGCPTFTIWEHGKKSKICLAMIVTAPRDEYAPHGSMSQWKYVYCPFTAWLQCAGCWNATCKYKNQACLTVLVRLLFSSTSESLLWRHHYQTCTDKTMFPWGEKSTCCCSSAYTWSQVVSFHWIMAMIGCPTFPIWEHGKKSKICLAIIVTAPRDEYAPHGSMSKWK